jgi:hypothetical protein
MTHRGVPEHGLWWKLGRDLLFLAVAAGASTVLFIIGDLLLYGHVNW